MEYMDSFWTYHESIDELKQQLLYTSIELESVKAEAEKHMKIHKAYEKQSLGLLNMVIQERDEAREQFRWLLNKLVTWNYTTLNNDFLPTVLPQLSPKSPLVNPIIPILSTTESNSFCEPCNYHSHNSSPVSSVFIPVSSPELSSIHAGALSNKMGFFNQPLVQEYKGIELTTVVPPGASEMDQYIDNLVQGKTLPQKGKLWQSVVDAGPLLETLLVAGPIPKWRNPPPLSTFHIPPPFTGNLNQKPTGLSIHAPSPDNARSYVEMPCGSLVTSNAVLQIQEVASSPLSGIRKGISEANGNNSLPSGKRQRFL